MTETDLIRAIAQREDSTGRKPKRLLISPRDCARLAVEAHPFLKSVEMSYLITIISDVEVDTHPCVPLGRIVALDDATEGLGSRRRQ